MTEIPNDAIDTKPFEPVELLLAADPAVLEGTMPCDEAVRTLALMDTGRGEHICVTAPDGRYLGMVTLHQCAGGGAGVTVDRVARRDHPVARPDWTAEEAAHKVVNEGLEALPVIDGNGNVKGVVTALAAHRFLLDKLKADSNVFSGLVGDPEDDYLKLSIWADFRRRVPWILGLAVAGLAAGYVVHLYESALDALVILALYMPMVADTGGNVGTQSASLVTRAISSGSLAVGDAARVLWRETRVSLLLAGALFLFAFLKVLLISNVHDVPEGLTLHGIGLAIAVALAVQVVSATLIGAILPVASLAARQDPAVVSGPALTTIVDVTGLLIYFSITTQMLGLKLVETG
ncbi:magnesium transporter [Labrenzia sp. 011]|uniref:magnesium transporter n=1 Tax=Labrenzia sp. 011 TaxID=2171494 RepID=UPI000D523658|nr:magnesium transporter [Labrenzia sp. 011]PVB60466.1 magnesium transporter [Labrenzia sp. 011]